MKGLRAMLVIPAMLCLVLAPEVSNAKTVKVQSRQVRIRSGAGNYYAVVYRAQRGAELDVVDEKDGWYEVRLPDGTSGYVSIKSLSKPPRGDGYEMAAPPDEEGVGEASASEMMAATKGVIEVGPFAKDYAVRNGADPGLMARLQEIPFSPEEYMGFKATLPSGGKVKPKGMRQDEYFSDTDVEIGSALALRLCRSGLSDDAALRKYVSMVGTAVVENTPLRHETFVFLVLESPEVGSFALPGGYVLVTKGAIELMENEAELAGVLSHEVVHVVERHGISELERQSTRISGERLHEKLDDEVERLGMDRGDRALMEDLDQMADSLFERLISGRVIEAEDEADSLGTVLLYNTGYRADGLKGFVLLAGGVEKDKKDPGYSHRTPAERAASMDRTIRKYRLTRKDRGVFKERFRENTP